MFRPLLRWQAYELFNALEAAGVNSAEFRWEKDEPRCIVTLKHTPTGYFCRFVFDGGGSFCYVVYSPGSEVFEASRSVKDWKVAFAAASDWVKNLNKEIHTPDVWRAIAQGLMPDRLDAVSNAPLAPSECDLLSAELRTIRDNVLGLLEAERKLTDVDKAFINRKFAEAEEARTRFGRKDYIVYFVGLMTTIFVKLAVTPETTMAVYRAAVNGIFSLLGHVQALPALP